MANEIRLKLAIDGGPAVSSEVASVGKSLTALGGQASAAAGSVEQSLNRVTMSAKATSAAMRNVPAQFTDIVVSLQGGQAPLTVLLQQGGQLKDMFGGVGNAAKALGGYVLGLVNPFTVAAASGAVLALAYTQGAAEGEAYNKSLITTGNAAGTTSVQLSNMANSVAAATKGTVGAAASVLAQLAGSSHIAAAQFESIAAAAVLMKKTTGAAVADTVKQFSELGKDPLQASLKLNEATHFLTLSVYEQIKALSDQGRELEAGVVAQNAYADVMKTRAPELIDNLGLVERAWSRITSGAKAGWDAMLSVGRTVDPTIALQKQLDYYTNPANNHGLNGIDPRVKSIVTDLKEQLAYHKHIADSKRDLAAFEATNALAVENKAKWDKAGLEFVSKRERMNLALIAANIDGQRELQAGTITQIELDTRLASIRDKYKETEKKTPHHAEKISDFQKLTRVIAEKQGADDQQLAAGHLLTESDKIRAKMLADLSVGAIKLTASERASTEEKLRNKAATELQIAAEKFYADEQKKRFDSSSTLIKSAVDEAEKNEELARTFGMTKTAIEQLELARLEEQLAQKTSIGQCTAETAALESLIDAKKRNLAAVGSLDAQKAGADAAKVTADEWKKTSESINSTLTDALMRGFESGKGAFDNLWASIKNTLKTSVLKVLIQPVTGALTSMTMSGMAAAGQGGATNALTSLSAVQSLKGLYDTASGGLNVGAKLGQYLVDNVGGQMMGEFASGMTNVASMQSASMAAQAGGAQLAGVIAGSVLNGVSGYGISKALSGGFSIDGFNVNAIAGIASMIPGIGPIAGVIGGLVNRAFGQGATEVRAQGTEGTFSAAGFSGNNYANLHRDGGWFSSDSDWKTTSALSGATAKAWGDAFTGVKASVAGMATSLGLSTASINSYSKSINLAAGASAETITSMFSGMADEIATRVAPGLTKLGKQGETTSATLSRLGTSLTTANSWLSLLRQRLLGVSLSGGEAASKLADAFGGLDKLTSSAKSFYETYYTEGERSARSMSDMAQALALVGLALPDSKDALKALAGTLDLTTESGRSAYAVLLTIAPEYAATADALAKLSKETATQLLATFTGNGLLVPALDAARLKVGDFTGGVQVLTGDLSFINKIMGDASSGVISLGSGVVQLDTGMSQSQLSAGLLTGQMDALRDRTDKTRIDFAGLGDALQGVNTATFIDTIGLVFENLATRISGVIGGINSERVAVREAALQIISPQVMSKGAIAAAIAAIRTSSSSAGVNAAGQALNSADYTLREANAAAATAETWRTATVAEKSRLSSLVDTTYKYMKDLPATFDAARNHLYWAAGQNDIGLNTNAVDGGRYSLASSAYRYDAAQNRMSGWDYSSLGPHSNYEAFRGQRGDSLNTLDGANTKLAQSEQDYANAATAYNNYADVRLTADQRLTAFQAAKVGAEVSAKSALLAYTAAQQSYIVEASKSVPKLTKLREETLKYYEAQKQLAGLMTTSAAGIRSTISAYTFSQKTDEQKYQDLAGQFSSAYSMSKITTGETLAGYGDKINALINPMIESLTATGRDGLIASYLAQAESVASSIDASVISLGDYQADSLSLLGSIDGVLAELDDGTQAVARAVKSAGDATLNGLAAVISAITHAPAPSTSSWSGPAFASGGAYQGGLALVGEQGPELINFDQPGQVYTASQTRGMLSGGRGGNTDRLEALVERQAQQLEAITRELVALRREAAATASSNEKMAKQGDRLEVIGMPVRNAQGQSLETVVAA